MRYTEGLLQLAVAQYVNWWRVIVVPNLCLFHEMDVAVLTRAGCLVEYEIKVSQADWNNDRKKDELGDHWRVRRNMTCVDRFYYVVAPKLKAPDWLPEWAGILRAYEPDYRPGTIALNYERAAKRRRGAVKPDERQREAIYRAAHNRFWTRAMKTASESLNPPLNDVEPDVATAIGTAGFEPATP